MSIARDPSIRDLNACGCCEGRGAQTPARIHNRPGLTALAYRVGTHGAFKQSMLAALSSSDRSALENLNTRDDDDFSIALIDAWATVADVLTFYHERTANELFLGTATERRSVIDLAQLIGYRLRPGVAASTGLAFRLEEGPGAPGSVTIDTGTKVQSLPGPGEQPQTFETVEPVDARVEWNALRPQSRTRVIPEHGSTEVYLVGVNTGLQPGDGLFMLGTEREVGTDNEQWDFRRVETVTPDPDADFTRVTWDRPVGHFVVPPASRPKVFAMRQRAALFGHNAPDWRAMPDSVKDGFAAPLPGEPTPDPTVPVTNWPRLNIFYAYVPNPDDDVPEGDTVHLDALYQKIANDSWVVLASPDYAEAYQVLEVAEAARSEFTISGKSTRLQLSGENLTEEFGRALRDTVVFAQSEQLEIAAQPLFPAVTGDDDPFQFADGTLAPVEGASVIFEPPVPDFEEGRQLIVAGRRLRARVTQTSPALALVAGDGREKQITPDDVLFVLARSATVVVTGVVTRTLTLVDETGFTGTVSFVGNQITLEPARDSDPQIAEIVTVKECISDEFVTTVAFDGELANVYDRPTVVIHGNVAAATHGESVSEILGSGDASEPYQRYRLRQSPLTYVPSDDPSGGESTLELRVNDVLWHETPSLYGHGPRDRVYVTELSDDGETTVQFGDGIAGARPPTGQENIGAAYRKGIGDEGEVEAGQLSLLMTRPLGVQGVTNPLPSTGAQDPQRLEDARDNAPLTVLTLDRIVSLQDYEDFAAGFSGIAKALATWTWAGDRRGVLLTVAGDDGAPVQEGTSLFENLVSSVRRYSNPRVPFLVKTYREMTFKLAGTVMVHPDYIPDTVLAGVRDALLSHFSFEERSFGQIVALSEVVEAVHDVPGVVAVDIDQLYRSDEPPSENAVLVAGLPPSGKDVESVAAAEILTIDPASLDQIEVRQ